jgi:hypothetical protein
MIIAAVELDFVPQAVEIHGNYGMEVLGSQILLLL